jgi:hypothetical protein
MRKSLWLTAALLPFLLGAVIATAEAPPRKAPAAKVAWKKLVLDRAFRAEGVAVADVNRDGKLDVLVGDVWYENPGNTTDPWKVHVIRQGPKFNPKGYDPHGYSHSFLCWADDINHDGWPDLIVIDFPGEPCYWYENPGDKGGLWKEHVIWHSACNETPQYVDLFGKGQRVLLMGFQPIRKMQVQPDGLVRLQTTENEGQMAYFTPGKDPTSLWEMHPVSAPSRPGKPVPGTFRYSHGLGVGDLSGDGRLDVLCTDGWWEQPAQQNGHPWKFHPANLGPACADMYAHDMDGDGKADVISSSAHDFGIWWHQRQPGGGDSPTFIRRDLFPKLFSESHALHFVDIDGDGLKDLVTGRRWWAHGPKGDPGADGPAVLYWFQAKRDKTGSTRFVPHLIDDDSGVGTQFTILDMNGDGLPDIIISNKKGVFVFLQVRPGVEARKEK